MNELVQRLMERAHLSEEQARQAASVMADFLREHASSEQLQGLVGKLPGLREHADKIPGDIGDRAADFLGGMFKKPE
jgi:hypothetical protein